MDNFIDDWPLTGSGETTFKLVNNCLSVVIGD